MYALTAAMMRAQRMYQSLHGLPRVNDRRVLNGIFWVQRSVSPWRDLPENFGPYTTCYNRFVRWRRAGVWDQLMNALATGYDAAVQMIDTSVVRVHQHGACIAANSEQLMGRSRGGLTTKIHAVVDTSGLPVRVALTTGEAHDNRLVLTLLSGLKSGACCSLIVDLTPIGSEDSLLSTALGRTSRQNAIARSQSALALISIERAI